MEEKDKTQKGAKSKIVNRYHPYTAPNQPIIRVKLQSHPTRRGKREKKESTPQKPVPQVESGEKKVSLGSPSTCLFNTQSKLEKNMNNSNGHCAVKVGESC